MSQQTFKGFQVTEIPLPQPKIKTIIRTHNEDEAQELLDFLRSNGFIAIVRHGVVEVLQ